MRYLVILTLLSLLPCPALALQPRDLRLVPFPKEVTLERGRLALTPDLRLSVVAGGGSEQAARDLAAAVGLCAGFRPPLAVLPGEGAPWTLTLAKPGVRLPAPGAVPEQAEGYALQVTPAGVVVRGRDVAGLTWGIQTLRQLVIANLQGRALPCLRIRDWPALAWRGFQDDITRGRSSLLSTLQREVRTSSLLKLNYFTYYLEHQYEFAGHPVIGPAGGSLTPAELRALVGYGRRYGTPIVGCQQSFGHFWHILKHPEYAALREGNDCLNPLAEGAYRLLDDMYGAQIPLLETPLFNVCCDETVELGTGPAKALAAEIGVGGVYARHMQRVHDLVTGKYGKRMMMWGDIISQHPEHLGEIPKDTIMLSWGYQAADTFEPVIMPLKQAGFDFFVCPGVSNWSRILPDYAVALVNIHNYVRDGVRLGAMGMLNTSWVDDGESLAGYNWYGMAWGAECAWTGSTTSVADFNRRLGAVLFGERGDHFGRAIALLAKTHTLPGYSYMFNTRFWQGDWADLPVDREAATRQARALLAVVEPALAHLEAARREARVEPEQIAYTMVGAERMRLMATRWLDLLAAAEAYQRAREARNPRSALPHLRQARDLLAGICGRHRALQQEYRRLWLLENRPYALDWVMDRYDRMIAAYREIQAGVERAIAEAEAGRPLPDPASLRLRLVERGRRATAPNERQAAPLAPEAPWACPGFPRRLGITVTAPDARADQPLEVDLPAGVGGAIRLVEVDATGSQSPLPAQLLRGAHRLAALLPGTLEARKPRRLLLYYGGHTKPEPALPCRQVASGKWEVENSALRLLVGAEGAHIFRWQVKALGNLDLTEPGEDDWRGFADINGVYRRARNTLRVEAGPALVRLRCTGPSGLVKTFSIWQGMPWVEVTLNTGSPWLANYDNIAVMGAQTATPGRYLFSDGAEGPLLPLSPTPDCQVHRGDVRWGAKYLVGGPLLALMTPEIATSHLVGPGSGMGGPCVEQATPTAHFVIYGGACPADPRATLDRLQAALDYTRPPAVVVWGEQSRQ